MLCRWEQLPKRMRTEAVRPYYEILKKKRLSLLVKRMFDVTVSLCMLIGLAPLFAIISILIVKDSKGGIFYRQERVTQYGRKFKIFKFRTMVADADRVGTQVTLRKDPRITRVGAKLRRYRLDEIPQLFNILRGDMTLVGARPESVYYVTYYTPEMLATLLLPAGVTSKASIKFKDEAKLLEQAENADRVYVQKILPKKMKYNLESIKEYRFLEDVKILIQTVAAVLKKEEKS